jgi:hypothetical protein
MYGYKGNCVNTSGKAVGTLMNMIDNSITITRETFLKHVNRNDLKEIEQDLGYELYPSQGLTMAGDYMVSYHRSKWGNKRCYYFTWSAIEYFFY